MQNILTVKIDDLMTSNFVSAHPKMIMTEISEIFEKNSFHHLPVIDEENKCIGVISKSDYYQLQDVFTRLNTERSQEKNRMMFRSLIASEVMSKELVSLPIRASVYEAIDIFLKNKIHSIVITKEEKCVGIMTPYDILEFLNEIKNV